MARVISWRIDNKFVYIKNLPYIKDEQLTADEINSLGREVMGWTETEYKNAFDTMRSAIAEKWGSAVDIDPDYKHYFDALSKKGVYIITGADGANVVEKPFYNIVAESNNASVCVGANGTIGRDTTMSVILFLERNGLRYQPDHAYVSYTNDSGTMVEEIATMVAVPGDKSAVEITISGDTVFEEPARTKEYRIKLQKDAWTGETVFTVIGIKDGKGGNTYKIIPNIDVITLDPNTENIYVSNSGDDSFLTATGYKNTEKIDGDAEYKITYSIDTSYQDDEFAATTELVSPGISIIGGLLDKQFVVFYLWQISDGAEMLLARTSVPIVRNGERGADGSPGISGARGASTRLRDWKRNTEYQAGEEGERFIDVVYKDSTKKYYLCIKAHGPVDSVEPDVDEGWEEYWEPYEGTPFTASKIATFGSGTDGWVIDKGMISHTNSSVTLDSRGKITVSNPRMVYHKFRCTGGEAVYANIANIEGEDIVSGTSVGVVYSGTSSNYSAVTEYEYFKGSDTEIYRMADKDGSVLYLNLWEPIYGNYNASVANLTRPIDVPIVVRVDFDHYLNYGSSTEHTHNTYYYQIAAGETTSDRVGVPPSGKEVPSFLCKHDGLTPVCSDACVGDGEPVPCGCDGADGTPIGCLTEGSCSRDGLCTDDNGDDPNYTGMLFGVRQEQSEAIPVIDEDDFGGYVTCPAQCGSDGDCSSYCSTDNTATLSGYTIVSGDTIGGDSSLETNIVDVVTDVKIGRGVGTGLGENNFMQYGDGKTVYLWNYTASTCAVRLEVEQSVTRSGYTAGSVIVSGVTSGDDFAPESMTQKIVLTKNNGTLAIQEKTKAVINASVLKDDTEPVITVGSEDNKMVKLYANGKIEAEEGYFNGRIDAKDSSFHGTAQIVSGEIENVRIKNADIDGSLTLRGGNTISLIDSMNEQRVSICSDVIERNTMAQKSLVDEYDISETKDFWVRDYTINGKTFNASAYVFSSSLGSGDTLEIPSIKFNCDFIYSSAESYLSLPSLEAWVKIEFPLTNGTMDFDMIYRKTITGKTNASLIYSGTSITVCEDTISGVINQTERVASSGAYKISVGVQVRFNKKLFGHDAHAHVECKSLDKLRVIHPGGIVAEDDGVSATTRNKMTIGGNGFSYVTNSGGIMLICNESTDNSIIEVRATENGNGFVIDKNGFYITAGGHTYDLGRALYALSQIPNSTFNPVS